MSVSQPDPLLPVLRDDELSERAAAVFAPPAIPIS